MERKAVCMLSGLLLLLILTPILTPAASGKYRSYRVDEIKTVSTGSCGGYLSPFYSYEWDFGRMRYSFSCTNSSTSDVQEFSHSYRLTTEDVEAIAAVLNDSGVFQWKESYGNEGTDQAGDSFSIVLHDGTVRTTKLGYGEQPPNYEAVKDVLFAHNGAFNKPENRVYQPDEIRSVEISDCGGYLSPYQIETWDFETLTYTFTQQNSGSSNEAEFTKQASFSKADAAQMLEALNRCGAFSYEKEYDDPESISCEAGTEFTVQFSDEISWTTYFSDNKPPQFDVVTEALRRSVPNFANQT